jgi:hypothetical protein
MGGYLPGTTTPGPLLQGALDYVNNQLQRMDDAIHKEGLTGSTAIIVTAKHGQSPQDPNLVRRIKGGPIIDAINQAWLASDPTNPNLIGPAPTTTCGRATCPIPRRPRSTSSRTGCGPTTRLAWK